jgi:hypothetical protein
MDSCRVVSTKHGLRTEVFMEYIRKFYGVPAKRGGRIIYGASGYGTIVGSMGAYLRIRMDGEKQVKSYHPQHLITYI